MKLGAGFNKLVSFAIVWCMVISSFLGVLLIAVPEVGVSAQGEVLNGDTIVGTGYGDNFTIHDDGGKWIQNSLTIRAGGMVQIINSTVIFSSSYSGATPVGAGINALTLTIEDGGILILDNSTLTVDTIRSSIIPALGVVVRHGGYLESRMSNISFSGHLLVDDARFSLIDSTISGAELAYNSVYFPTKVFSSSPVMLFMSSEVSMIGSRVLNMYDNGTYNSVTANPGPYSFNYQFAKDNKARQYVDYFLERDVNAAFDPILSTVTGQNALSMTMNDTRNVTVAATQRLVTTGFDMGGLVFEATDIVPGGIVLHVSYKTSTSAAAGSHGVFSYTPQYGTATPTAIDIVPTFRADDPSGTNFNVTDDQVLPDMAAQSLSKMTLDYTNTKAGNVYIDRIWVTIDLKLPTYRNITIGGSTNLVVADTYIPLNNINENNGTDATQGAYHKLVALDQSIANLYGMTVQNSTGGYFGTNVFKTRNLAKVITANGTNDGTGENVNGLYAQGDALTYDLSIGQTMNIVKYNIGELTGSIKSLTVSFVYYTEASYAQTNYIQYSFGGSALKNTNMRPSLNLGQTTIGPFDLYANGVNSIDKLRTLTLSFANAGGATIHFDRMFINIQTQPQVALYRWVSLEVTDNQLIPVGNVGVTSSNAGTGAIAYYLDQSGAVAAPPQAILNYLGKTAANFNRTATSGMVTIPLLSDVLNSSNLRNGKAFDYNLVFKYRTQSQVLYVMDDSNGGISTNFRHFPNMINNVDERDVMFPTLSVIHGPTILTGTMVWVISGDAPVSIKGDIEVRDNARLIITSGLLSILNDHPNQFKITVSGSGSIELTSGTITANSEMTIFLKDNAVMSARNGSILTGFVNINIDGHSKVTLTDSNFVASNITAPSTSFGNLTATNVTLQAGIANFGGQATAVLTSVSIPAIHLQDDARAWSYRLLTVTVMDGTLVHGIAGAFVELDRSTGMSYATAITGADGKATFNLLSDWINRYGASHFNDNYRVNATYWFHGVRYDSTGAINARYTQVSPDGLINNDNGSEIAKSDIAINVNILGALPELDPPFWASDYSPARGASVGLIANITNNGVVNAYSVLVRFKDLTTGAIIADQTITSIAPGEHSNITVLWTVVYPVGNHTLNVTVDPFGAIPQLNRSNNWNQTTVSVQGVPDLSVLPGQISINPAIVETNSTVSIRADIVNGGDDMDQTAVIRFYDVFHGLRISIGNFTLPAIRGGQTGVAFATWQHMLPGDHNITVVIDENNTLLEASKGNNIAGVIVKVMNYPDLVATNLQFKLSSSGSVVTQVFIGDSVMLSATVMNTGEYVASDFLVRFWLGTASTGTKIGDVVVPSINAGATTDIQMGWIAASVDGSGRNQSRMITVEVNPFTHGNDTPVMEMTYENNIISSSLLVVDNRADLWFPAGVSVKSSSGSNSTSQAVQGQTIDITFVMGNEGLKAANGAVLEIYVKDSDNYKHLLMSMIRDLSGGASVQISFPWVVNVTSGTYSLVVEMNSRHVIEESNYTNNIDSRAFAVNIPNPMITISVGSKTDFQPGESIPVSGMITNKDGSYALANQSLTIRLLDSAGLPVGDAITTKTDGTGAYSSFVFVPTDRSGSHSVSVTMNSGAVYSNSVPINVMKIFNAQGVPLWVFAIIAIIVIAVILVFSVYLYKYGLGKMVECGECGALIPESSKRCPRCGTEFEADTAKCSECGTWIPSRSKECPECGAKFMTEPVEEISTDDYMSSMRRQYDEYINGFREQAKAALGKKYSEDKFMDWLKTEPAYVTFEAWVAKKEEDRKASSLPCPTCGTLNPKGATICSKCGTVFDKALEMASAAESGEQAKPFRKIVKRSSDRKMVPKKVVKDNPETEHSPESVPEEQKKE
ncbi:MAG TPA: CARDB domain-containing protein [Methanomassiliicoccales archaeon]